MNNILKTWNFKPYYFYTSLFFIAVIMACIACRGGGSNPSEQDQIIPVIQPTVSPSFCKEKFQPEDAPKFDEIQEEQYTESSIGLKFYDIKQGTGVSPSISDMVTIDYVGWHVDGCMWDSTYIREAPGRFLLISLIRGWQETLMEMKEGGVRVVKIPYDLAFGATGYPPAIPPRTDLIFHMTLISVLTPEQGMATATAEAEQAENKSEANTKSTTE